MSVDLFYVEAQMNWIDCVAHFFGGAFLANCVPHLVRGMTGQSFQSPFAKPRGVSLSSATVNVLWGFFNLCVGSLLLSRVGEFDIRDGGQMACAGLGFLVLALFGARHFGQFHGGDLK